MAFAITIISTTIRLFIHLASIRLPIKSISIRLSISPTSIRLSISPTSIRPSISSTSIRTLLPTAVSLTWRIISFPLFTLKLRTTVIAKVTSTLIWHWHSCIEF